MTKSLTLALMTLFALLQYKLWFDIDGILSIWQLRSSIGHQTQLNTELKNHNMALKADIVSLKNEQDGIEERARHDLGMIKKGEIFVKFGEKP